MKQITISTSNGTQYTFYCDFRNTRDGFAHDTAMFRNGYPESKASAYYLNRTWEYWTYQTACMQAVNGRIKDRIVYMKFRFMQDNDYKRLTAARKAEFDKLADNDETIRELREVRDTLKTHCY